MVGISGDDGESHRRFRAKHDLPFTLLSDPDLSVAARYDSKGLMGMKRAVYLVDEAGHPTRRALDRVLALFRERLLPSS